MQLRHFSNSYAREALDPEIGTIFGRMPSRQSHSRKIVIDIDAGANILSDLHEHNPIIFDDNAMSSIGNVITG